MRAVLAALEQLEQPQNAQLQNLRAIVDHIRPSAEVLLTTKLRHDPRALVQQAIRANISASVNRLRNRSEVLERAIAQDGLVVVGAEYSLETGVVCFLDGIPKAG